ncbi:g10977 [Coccomyxa viridis]|uniref:G10977 protein n=1 Tax=Coccomyxa viridis TaxID=1274662 RepID=A0ABP1G6R1_9CHLO
MIMVSERLDLQELEWKRSTYVVSTKIFWGGKDVNETGLSMKHIMEGLQASLGRLGLAYVDLVFCHRPDPDTPMEEIVRGMNLVIQQGKAFYWGTSEWPVELIMEAWIVARELKLIGPAFEQPEYNLLTRDKVEREYLPLYKSFGLGLTTWSPLASGVLTGKYALDHVPAKSRFDLEKFQGRKEKVLKPELFLKMKLLEPIAEELDCSLAQLSLAWCIRNPHVSSVIMGATNCEQVKENLGALSIVEKLTPQILEKIETVVSSRPQPAPRYR